MSTKLFGFDKVLPSLPKLIIRFDASSCGKSSQNYTTLATKPFTFSFS